MLGCYEFTRFLAKSQWGQAAEKHSFSEKQPPERLEEPIPAPAPFPAAFFPCRYSPARKSSQAILALSSSSSRQ